MKRKAKFVILKESDPLVKGKLFWTVWRDGKCVREANSRVKAREIVRVLRRGK